MVVYRGKYQKKRGNMEDMALGRDKDKDMDKKLKRSMVVVVAAINSEEILKSHRMNVACGYDQ